MNCISLQSKYLSHLPPIFPPSLSFTTIQDHLPWSIPATPQTKIAFITLIRTIQCFHMSQHKGQDQGTAHIPTYANTNGKPDKDKAAHPIHIPAKQKAKKILTANQKGHAG